MICSACRLMRSAADVLAFWPVGNLDRRRFVCRPTAPTSGYLPLGGPCFAAAVGPASMHSIALAVESPVLQVVRGNVRPSTTAWAGLMRECGVRAA